jgi:hypothetical protein
MDEVDKDLLSQELEQANNKLNWYNEKFKEYSDLQTNMDLLISKNKQLENDLEIQRKSNLEQINQYEQTISQFNSKKNNQEQEQQSRKFELFNLNLFMFSIF